MAATDFIAPSPGYFERFVEEEKARISFYERLCKVSRRILPLSCPRFIKKRIEDPIYLSGLKASEDEVFSLFVMSSIISLLIFLPLSLLDFPSTSFLLIFPPFIVFNVLSYPHFYSEVVRIRAGNEMVSIILYMVTYLSFSPVYEKAVQFTASRCHGPMGNDFKRLMYDLHVGRFTNIKQAMASYSRKWTLWNEDFINSLILLQLIELQPSKARVDEILKASTEKIMTSCYSKMEDYAFGLKMPSTLLMLFGIMLPLMGLVMFPLTSIFLTESINPFYIGIGYTVILPLFLWWFLYRMISKRPATYSHSEKLEEVSPEKYIEIKKLRMKIPIIPIAFLLGFMITIPGLFYYLELYSYHSFIFSHYTLGQALNKWQEYCLSRYAPSEMIRDTFRAMFVMWGVAFAIIFSTYFRSKKPYELDLFIRKLEKDFQDGLFELQSALYQNIPVETAVLKVINQYRRLNKSESPIAIFFTNLHERLVRSAVSIKEALFGKGGLVSQLPSSLIKNIMGIVVSALDKGPLIASDVTRNIVSYLTRLEEIEHMIKNSMNEILSNLIMQAKFIAPFMAGIVASSSVVIIQLLQAVAMALGSVEKLYNLGTNVGGSMYNTLDILNLKRVMPPTLMELIAGIYLVECVIITAIFVTGISRGFNKVYRDYLISRFLMAAVFLFTIVFFIMIFSFQPVISHIKI